MKKIIIISLIIVLLFSAGIIYLNNVFLPKTIKALIIKGIEEQTNSKVSLGSLRVNIFKGLVLKELNIYKGESSLLKIKEASCIFFPLPLLEKKIAIPIVNLDSAQIFLERRKDNTFNVEDLFTPKPLAKTLAAKKGFTVLIYRINISNAKIIFQDSTFNQPFSKTLEKVNLTVNLALPASIKFKLSALIQAAQPVKISAKGEFKIPTRALNAKLDILDFSPHDFAPYYAASGLKISEDSFNLSADIKLSNNVFYIDAEAQGENFSLQQDKVSSRISLDLRAVLEYSLNDKKWQYSGSSKIYNTDISGIQLIDKIKNVSCGIIFNNSGLKTENLSAQIFNLPVTAKVALMNFNDPEIALTANSSFSLVTLQAILKDTFKLNFPGAIHGQGDLDLSIDGKLSEADALAIKGELGVTGAGIKSDQLSQQLQGINGKFVFLKDKLHQSPFLEISLISSDIALASTLSFNNRLIKVYRCSGRYYLVEFSADGSIDVTDSSRPEVNLAGRLLIDLELLAKTFPDSKGRLEKIKPIGKLRSSFTLSGNANELKNCAIAAKVSSDSISLYGLKGTNLSLDYTQSGGVANIPSMSLSLYGGTLEASFKAGLDSQKYPYWLDANMQNVKIEELKLDTPAKSKDIAGVMQAAVKANGLLSDLPSSQGKGMVAINKGKLWELDLFKGMGKLLFSQEFANIIFSEGKCDFVIQDKSIFTNNLILKSSMVNLSGPVKIGFDQTVSARLNVDVISDLVPLTGTFKDVTTAILSQGEKFAVIKISGTFKEPKYKFEAAMTDIIQGLANTFLKSL